LNQPKNFFLIDDDPDDQEIFGMVLKELDSTIGCDFFCSDGANCSEQSPWSRRLYPEARSLGLTERHPIKNY
jgi:hypothetical protein